MFTLWTEQVIPLLPSAVIVTDSILDWGHIYDTSWIMYIKEGIYFIFDGFPIVGEYQVT